jgi:2-polyprenyl-3-methyl-5-hydroxy-6-metoxy-1,4-benzoquinol methylase
MPSSLPDFSRRVEPQDLLEWLDEPRSYEELHAYMLSLEQVNTLTLGARPTLHWLEQFAQKPRSRPLRIIDVGCGSGDMLRRIERWAKRRGVAVELTGIDLNPITIQVARDWTPEGAKIEWIAGDAFAYTEPVDLVISALVMHHLSEPAIVGLLAWMEETALCGWYINDLVREPTPYKIFSVAAAILRWHKMVRHDGPVSFRRSFREEDWQRMLSGAGIRSDAASMQRWTPGRLCVGRTKVC